MLARKTTLAASLPLFLATTVLGTMTAISDDEQFTMHVAEDAPGYDYQRFDPPTLSYCQNRCAADSQCKAFTYNRVRHVCFLKHKADFPLSSHSEAITGRKTGANRFSIRRNRDAPGYDYARIDPPALSDCESQCGADPQCRTFSYNVTKKVCFLKYRSDIPLIRHAEAITGIKVSSEVSSPKRSQFAAGTGFAVSGDGLILTNQHVVDGCRVIGVEGFGTGTLKAEDRFNDLALVKIEGRPSPVAFQTGSIEQGETVFVSGYPYGGELGFNFTNGIVSALTGPDDDRRYVQFTAPVQPGNSGGPLLDRNGHVVGVVVARLGDEVKPQNVNFAIRGDVAERFLKINGVEPLMASSSDALSPSEIAKRAKFYTYRLSCIERVGRQ